MIELNVTCPVCEHFFDILEDTYLDEEGCITNQILPVDRWEIPADVRLHCSPICPNCSAEFDVEGVVW